MLETGARLVRVKGGKPNKQLPHLDGRTKASTRFKRLCAELAAELAAERGRDPSLRETALIRQAAAAVVSSEHIQGLVLSGTATEAELSEQSKLAHVVIRTINLLGLDTKTANNGPDLDAYLKAKGRRTGR